MDSYELSAWRALFEVHELEAQARRDIADSGDGKVIVSGQNPDDPDDDDEDAELDPDPWPD